VNAAKHALTLKCIDGATLLHPETRQPVGRVTSGTWSPCLQRPIGQAYVQPNLASVGQQLLAEVRGRPVQVRITRMPFVPTRYFKPNTTK